MRRSSLRRRLSLGSLQSGHPRRICCEEYLGGINSFQTDHAIDAKTSELTLLVRMASCATDIDGRGLPADAMGNLLRQPQAP